jgi:hypothetical protein
MKRWIWLPVLSVLAVGCARQRYFSAETFESGGNEIRVKGWTKADSFCADVRLKPADETVTLHSLQLVRSDGRRLQPTRWSDETSRPPRLSLGLGLGFPIIGSLGGGLGVGVPLTGRKRSGRIKALEAGWQLAKQPFDPAEYSLEIHVVSVRADLRRVTTFSLDLARPTEGDDPEKKTREIDMRLKGPPTIRDVEK